MDDFDFEWDESKRQANRRKHGVDFADTVECFYDSLSKVMLDPDHHTEHRYVLVGEDVHRRLMVVVYSQPCDGVIRIISARAATPSERRVYVQR